MEKKKTSDNEYYYKNHANVRKKQRVYREKNREKLNAQTQRINTARLKTDPTFKMKCLLHTRIGNHLRGNVKMGGVTFKIIGCSPEYLRRHLGEMCGKNGYQIDHIFPLTLYDYKTEIHKMTNWQNMQMLTSEENNQKNNKLPTKEMAMKVPMELWPFGVKLEDLPDIYPGWATALTKHSLSLPGVH